MNITDSASHPCTPLSLWFVFILERTVFLNFISACFVVLRYLWFCAICKLALPVVLALASLTYNDCQTNQDKDRLVRYAVLTRVNIAS